MYIFVICKISTRLLALISSCFSPLYYFFFELHTQEIFIIILFSKLVSRYILTEIIY